MEINELKSQIFGWPRAKSGRLILSDENRGLIAEAFRKAGIGQAEFCELSGLSTSTLYKILGRRQKSTKQSRELRVSPQAVEFSAVKIVQPPSQWIISGPSGIRVECTSINQLAQLWKALC